MESQRKRGQHRRYERLRGSRSRQKSQDESSSSSGSGKLRKKLSWRKRIAPRLRVFRLVYTKKLLVRLRDAYVKILARLGNSSLALEGGERVMGNDRPALKEDDEKVMTRIYRCMMVQGQMAGSVGSVVGW